MSLGDAIMIGIWVGFLSWIVWKMAVEPAVCLAGYHDWTVLCRNGQWNRWKRRYDGHVTIYEGCARCHKTRSEMMMPEESDAWLIERYNMRWKTTSEERKNMLHSVYDIDTQC